jgi:beta-galactosidase
VPAPAAQPTLARDGVAWRQIDADWIAEADGTSVRVDGKTGQLVALTMQGENLLRAPVRLNFWRVPIDNDFGWKAAQKMEPWKNAGSNSTLLALKPRGAGALAADLKLPVGGSTAQLVYALHANGSVEIEMTVTPRNAPELPRAGVTFALPQRYQQIRWFGRGPQESYADRKTGAAVGEYGATVAGWVTHYVRPQENANRTDVRWIEFEDGSGPTLRIRTLGAPFGAGAWPYTADDLAQAKHDIELPTRDFTTVNLDAAQMGVGGDNSWSLPVHEEYRLPSTHPYVLHIELSAVGPDPE